MNSSVDRPLILLAEQSASRPTKLLAFYSVQWEKKLDEQIEEMSLQINSCLFFQPDLDEDEPNQMRRDGSGCVINYPKHFLLPSSKISCISSFSERSEREITSFLSISFSMRMCQRSAGSIHLTFQLVTLRSRSPLLVPVGFLLYQLTSSSSLSRRERLGISFRTHTSPLFSFSCARTSRDAAEVNKETIEQ